MDNLTHTLCGLALARAGGDRLGPRATPVIVLAANLPDADIVGWAWGGQPWFLCHHRGLTHAVAGLVVQALLVGLAAAAVARGGAEERRPRPGALVLAAALGLASHLLLDGLNTYGIRPWLPWDERWVYGDVAFIVDPWLWLAFGAAACLGAPRDPPLDATGAVAAAAEGRARAALDDVERLALAGDTDAAGDRAQAALAALGEAARAEDRAQVRRAWSTERAWWAAAGVLVVVIAGLGWGRAPLGVPLAWGGLAALALILRRRGAGAGRRRLVALAPLALAALYLVGLAALSRAADARARAAVAGLAPGEVEASVCHAAPAVPWRFRVIVATAGELLPVEVDHLAGRVALGERIPRGLAEPALPLVAGTPEHHAWRVFARLPWVRRDGQRLLLGDGRFSFARAPGERPRRMFSDLEVTLPGPADGTSPAGPRMVTPGAR